jgi:putative hemolysin
VVHDDLDDLVGVLFVTDLFRSRQLGRRGGRADGRGEEPEPPSSLEISRRLRQPYLVPESSGVLDALSGMRHRKRAFAVVVDEYGGVSGVLTIKDLLEPLVGDLNDEFDQGEDDQTMVPVDGSRWLVGGRVSVDDVNERLHLDIPEGEYVTLAGFLLDGLGRVPEVGATLPFGDWILKVVEMDKRRIVKVLVQHIGRPGAHANGTAAADTDDRLPATISAVEPAEPVAVRAPGTPSGAEWPSERASGGG